jgi:hypothetical protein
VVSHQLQPSREFLLTFCLLTFDSRNVVHLNGSQIMRKSIL